MVCSSPVAARGAPCGTTPRWPGRTVYRLIRPGGKPAGTPSRAPGRNANGSSRSAGGRSARSAKSPLVTTERPSLRAPGQAVRPGHRVAVTRGRARPARPSSRRCQRCARCRPGPARCRPRLQLDRGPHDEPGQAHAARRRPEQRGIGLSGHRAQLAVGQQDVERPHVPGEAARHVVVLAVDVGGDRAADGHLPGAGRNRHEPAGRQPRDHELLQADAGLAGHQAGRRVQVDDPVQPGGRDHHAAIALGRVVVAAAEAAGDHAAGGRRGPAARAASATVAGSASSAGMAISGPSR